jgi:two-component sensor histidine kinase
VDDKGEGDPARQVETRHKIANIFQLLSTLTRMRLQRAREPDGRRDLEWMLEMVQVLGVVQHRLHSPGGDDFANYLEDLSVQWRRGCAGRPIAIELRTQPVRVIESQASALALVASELVLNAIAHAFPDGRAGAITVELERLGAARAALTVSDDGQGYEPESVDKGRLGLWLVAGLAAQVRGALSTTSQGGVQCRLEFPVSASEADISA